MQSNSIKGTETSGMNKIISNSGANKQLSTPSRGRGRGRAKRQVCDVGARGTEPGLQKAPGKEHVAESCQKIASENPRKKISSKTRKPDQALYVPKSRKPDQALYVPRSRKNEKVSTLESTEKTELFEKPVKRTQKIKAEPPPKKKSIGKNIPAAIHVESEDTQESEHKTNVEEYVAMSTEEHKETNVTNVVGSSEIKDHEILEQNMSGQTLPSVNLHRKDKLTEGIQSNHPVAMDVEPLEVENKVLLGEEINEYEIPSSKSNKNSKHLLEETREMASDNMSSREEALLCDTECTEDLTGKHSAENVSVESSLKSEHNSTEKQDHENEEPITGMVTHHGNEEPITGMVTHHENEEPVTGMVTHHENEEPVTGIVTHHGNEEPITGMVTHHENEEPVTGMVTQDQTNINVTEPSEKVQKCTENTEVMDEGHSAINLDTVQKENCHENKEEESLEEDQLSEPSKPTTDDLENNEEMEKNVTAAEMSIDICSDVVNKDTAQSSDGDDWDSLFDESGEALSNDTIDQISEGIGNVKVSVKKTKQDYYNYHAKDNFDYGKFSHVIEIYDFPAEFKTEDLIQSFSGYRIKGFDIQWVDDTHALGIFSSSSIAQDALGLQNPMLRTRSLNQATRESKLKARKCVDFLQPAKARPETSASAARRLVSGALGLKSKETKEQRATELKRLKDAKEKKRTDKRITEDVWEGNTWRL